MPLQDLPWYHYTIARLGVDSKFDADTSTAWESSLQNLWDLGCKAICWARDEMVPHAIVILIAWPATPAETQVHLTTAILQRLEPAATLSGSPINILLDVENFIPSRPFMSEVLVIHGPAELVKPCFLEGIDLLADRCLPGFSLADPLNVVRINRGIAQACDTSDRPTSTIAVLWEWSDFQERQQYDVPGHDSELGREYYELVAESLQTLQSQGVTIKSFAARLRRWWPST